MIKLSVITINLNNVTGLKKTIDSVLPQLSSAVEFIVIDGASTDGSKELIEASAQHIAKWVSEKDKGIYFAQNKGLSYAKGEYCLFLNSGDYFLETDTLAKVLPALNKFDIVYGNMKINEGGNITDGVMPTKLDFEHMMKDTLWHPVSFIKKELFDIIGNYNISYKICADYDFFFKAIVVKKCKCLHLNQFITVFELGGLSSSAANVQLIAQERKRIQAANVSALRIFAYTTKEYLSDQLQRVKRWFR